MLISYSLNFLLLFHVLSRTHKKAVLHQQPRLVYPINNTTVDIVIIILYTKYESRRDMEEVSLEKSKQVFTDGSLTLLHEGCGC